MSGFGSGFGIYIHWPYCAHLCPYCDFNVYRARGQDHAPLIAAIEADIAEHAARFGRRSAGSIFLGGGTPSLLSGAEIERLLNACARAYDLASDCEITLEANPEDYSRFGDHVRAGVNRVSLGLQALDDIALKALGRWHDARTGVSAVEAAAATGARVSVDLIYAREGQGFESWRSELHDALLLPIEHVSLYQLTIEPETAFARRAQRGELVTPDNDEAAAFYEATQDICEAAGFPAYEISNHARAPSARARHNLIYWRGGDWIGVGPGAHGRVTHEGARFATEAHRHPKDYTDAVRETGLGWLSQTALSPAQQGDEILIMGLRVDEGFSLARVNALRPKPIKNEAIAWLERQGLIEMRAGNISLTAGGRLLSNKIAAELAI